ncbi:MAG: PAS domain-containing protein [Myxococcota bacterium]
MNGVPLSSSAIQVETLHPLDRSKLAGLFSDPSEELVRRLEHYVEYVARTQRPVSFEHYEWRRAPPTQSQCSVQPGDGETVVLRVGQAVPPPQWSLRHDRFAGLLEQINDVVVVSEPDTICDKTPRIVYVNAAFERMTGFSRDEVIGKTPRILQGPDTEPSARAAIRQALSEWKNTRVELKNYRKCGEPFFVELDISPVQDETGWYCYWVAVQRDVSRRHQLELMQSAQSRLNAVATLAAGLTHDIGNDLMSIASFFSIDGPEPDAEYRKELLKTVLAVHEKVRLFADHLTPRDRPDEPLELQSLLGVVGELCNRGTVGEVRVFGPEGAIRFIGSREHWSTMFLNVFVNAREACLEDPCSAFRVDVHILPTDTDMRIRIVDSGPGIPRELAERVFEPSYSNKSGDGGFGLPASRALAQVYGGTLRCVPREGPGACLEFRFPRERFTLQSNALESRT